MNAKNEKPQKNGLTDEELIEKYGDMVPPEFNEAMRNMLHEPSPTAPYKSDKSHIRKVKKPKQKNT